MKKVLSLLFLSFLLSCGKKSGDDSDAVACVVIEKSALDTQSGGTLLVKIENKGLYHYC